MSPAKNARDAKKVLGAVHWAEDPSQRFHDAMGNGNIHAEQYWKCPHIITRYCSGNIVELEPL